MSLTAELKKLLLSGPNPNGKSKSLLQYGGPATVRVQWMKHRVELIASCKLGHRPWAYWLIEQGLKQRPAGELGELRAIAQLGLFRDESERAYIERRIGEINRLRQMSRHPHRAVA